MSYDIYLVWHPDEQQNPSTCPTCGCQPPMPYNLPGPTYNLTPIFDFALTGEPLPNPELSEGHVVLLHEKTARPRGLRLLTGKLAKDTREWLEKACRHLKDPALEAKFRALEPANKWGTLETAQEVMDRLLQAATEYPGHTWIVQ